MVNLLAPATYSNFYLNQMRRAQNQEPKKIKTGFWLLLKGQFGCHPIREAHYTRFMIDHGSKWDRRVMHNKTLRLEDRPPKEFFFQTKPN